MKKKSALPLFAWVVWPCGDITQHEVLSHAICPFTNKCECELANSFGPIWRTWDEINTITYATYRSRGWPVAPEWTSGEGERELRPPTRTTTKRTQ